MKISEPRFYRARISEWPEGERPREKLLQLGPAMLSASELLAILMRTGSREHTAVDLGKTILSRFGGLQELQAIEHQEFFRLKGIGPAKAASLVAAFEISRRMASLPRKERLKIDAPEVIHRYFSPSVAHLKKEVFHVLALNSANLLLRDIRISEGILNSALVHPREVFKAAILESAASIILLHNHPSGEITPSPEDRRITTRLVEAGQLLDIPVLDHLIVTADRYFSFREAGLISE